MLLCLVCLFLYALLAPVLVDRPSLELLGAIRFSFLRVVTLSTLYLGIGVSMLGCYWKRRILVVAGVATLVVALFVNARF